MCVYLDSFKRSWLNNKMFILADVILTDFIWFLILYWYQSSRIDHQAPMKTMVEACLDKQSLEHCQVDLIWFELWLTVNVWCIGEDFKMSGLLCLQVADSARCGDDPQECDRLAHQRKHPGGDKCPVTAIASHLIQLFVAWKCWNSFVSTGVWLHPWARGNEEYHCT